MNKIFRTSLVLLTALPFAACQNDVQGPDGSQSSGKPVRLEVGLTYGDDNTRTTLQDVDGNLKCTWDKGDRVIVSSIVESGTTGNAVRFGEITLLDDYAGQVKGYFAGELMGIDNFDGKQVLFTYAGMGVETKDFDIDSHKLSIATQDGTLANLPKYDILRGYTEISVAGGIAYTPDMALTRYVAFAHFTLSLPQGVARTTEPVTISGEGVKNYITYKKSAGTATGQEGAITVNGSGNDLYVVLIPGTVAPEFAVTIGGKTYTGSLPSVKVEMGKYYRDNATHAGIPVEMEAPTGIDHTKNPLLKWAETNLDPTTETGFAENKWDKGYFYQWGNNNSYSGYTDARSRYQVYISKAGQEVSSVWGFNIYKGTSSTTAVKLGLGDTYTFTNETTTALPNHKYFLVATADCGANGTDWYPNRRNKGDDWSTRAKACGFESDAAPAGWHVATSAEYAEIMPSSNISASSSANFATEVGKGEVRSNSDCTYAIKWGFSKKTISTNDVRYVCVVSALVVEKGTAIADVDWNSEDVVVRYFPSAGYINPTYINQSVYQNSTYDQTINIDGYGIYLGQHRLCLPHPVGGINMYPKKSSTTVFLYFLSPNDMSNYKSAYWTADGDCYGFIYDLSSYEYKLGKNLPYSTTATITKCHGMPVRCVKD